MKKVHVVLDFIRIPIADKIAMGKNVFTQMTGNAAFPTPDIALSDLKTATDNLESRYIAALTGGKEATALMHQAEEAWDDRMRRLAMYVDRIANNDAVVIFSAGFNTSKQPVPAQRPELSVEPGKKSGCVLLRRQAVQGARSYVWQYSKNVLPETEAGWTFAQATSKASVELVDLVPITKYWFRVAAVTPQSTSAYNDPVMHVVS